MEMSSFRQFGKCHALLLCLFLFLVADWTCPVHQIQKRSAAIFGCFVKNAIKFVFIVGGVHKFKHRLLFTFREIVFSLNSLISLPDCSLFRLDKYRAIQTYDWICCCCLHQYWATNAGEKTKRWTLKINIYLFCNTIECVFVYCRHNVFNSYAICVCPLWKS